MDFQAAKNVVLAWGIEGLRNIRFSGGEPTLDWTFLKILIRLAREVGVERVALSTNGSASLGTYMEFIGDGLNDISISLDACCAGTGKTMSGGKDMWDKVIKNIEALAKLTYVTVGIVITKDNLAEAQETILLAHRLGVQDIRIIPAAQYSSHLAKLELPDDVLKEHPILKYRIENSRRGHPIRGIGPDDFGHCPLVLDDMAVAGAGGHGGLKHFPCIIYFREKGEPIGEFDPSNIRKVRQERADWAVTHDCSRDPICSKNCLDVCVEYNNAWIRKRAEIK